MATLAGAPSKSTTSTDVSPRLMLFEIDYKGHYAGYLQNFARSWIERSERGILHIVVSPPFAKHHADVVEELSSYSRSKIAVHVITDAEYAPCERSPRWKYWYGWSLFRQYASNLNISLGMLTYFDFFQLPIALSPGCPCDFAGIYFRPTYHYHRFPHHTETLKEKFKAARKRFLIQKVLRNPRLRFLLSLDPFVVEAQNELGNLVHKLRVFPEPVHRWPNLPADKRISRESLGVAQERTLFLLLGSLDTRKGVCQLLRAVSELDAEDARRFALVMVGPVQEVIREEVASLCASLAKHSDAKIVLLDRFVSDMEVQAYYECCDVVCTTYQHHMGMSSALVRAAGVSKPVLSDQYGLVGELVKRHRLGTAIDATNPDSIAKGIRLLLDRSSQSGFDNESATAFASIHTSEASGKVLFDEMFREIKA